MLACSFRPSRICLKQPFYHKIQNLNICPQSECSKPTLFSPAHCCALPLPSCRGCCWSSSSWAADCLRCLLRTWSPQSRCSWWSRSSWAVRGRWARPCHCNSTEKLITTEMSVHKPTLVDSRVCLAAPASLRVCSAAVKTFSFSFSQKTEIIILTSDGEGRYLRMRVPQRRG